MWRQNGQCTSGHLPFPETRSFSVAAIPYAVRDGPESRPVFVGPGEAGDGAGDDVGMTCG
ncbi:hypothetical protein UB45_08280 [Terrabacter sp. 28]|nr:hypothetical protein UB45_08280 [Terrabacter sp. 28]